MNQVELTNIHREYLAAFDRYLAAPNPEQRRKARLEMRILLGEMVFDSGARIAPNDEMATRPPGRLDGQRPAVIDMDVAA